MFFNHGIFVTFSLEVQLEVIFESFPPWDNEKAYALSNIEVKRKLNFYKTYDLSKQIFVNTKIKNSQLNYN